MRLDGRRGSNNISDRRGMSGKTLGIGGGIVGIIIAGIITLLSGGDISDVLGNVMQQSAVNNTSSTYNPNDPEEQRLFDLASKVLAGTEDVWTKIFREQGWGEYEPPKMVIYTGSIQTACGQGTAQVGPFYCSADETIYLDLDFFKTMQEQIGASGDFCYAYVIAHEVGHHVQYLRGDLNQAHAAMSRMSKTEANKMSVRTELQADYYAGVWGHVDNEMFQSIEPGDIEKAINAASKIGDDYLQKKAYGKEAPETFNHGRSEWRVYWLKKGLDTGDPNGGNTFTGPYPPR
ncbi:MAG: neutral zinc metallopeptidase [Muribaculaceae bacterium]|nr:neutral zinc metallopeptidase [Muribaculaceae bacterium]MDE6321855.1 neutral zinc metallopeptidase [Muribaculaceae bacterium]